MTNTVANPQDHGRAADQAEQSELFKYEALLNKDFIRVLHLLPGESNERIECRLHTLSRLEANDNYEALSYTWGESNEQSAIVCNNKLVKVSANLYDALRALRYPHETRILWSDAICINQEDSTEKGHQVKRMGNVYADATGVLAWVGMDDEGIAEDAFNLIRDTNKYMHAELEKHGDIHEIPTITSDCPIDFDRSRWEKVGKFVGLPWFDRLWVLQEAALAKRCTLIWGAHKTSISDLCALASFLGERGDLSTLVGDISTGKIAGYYTECYCMYNNTKSWRMELPYLSHIMELTNEQDRALFVSLLSIGRHMKASVELDRIFAFLGNHLAKRHDCEDELILEPEYGKTSEEVYLETACALLSHPREAPFFSRFRGSLFRGRR
jgi:Heterokaryon incompatibility protein (HET)